MLIMASRSQIAIVLAGLFACTFAVPYSKYGRSCKDIGCRSDEVCVMAEDPCSNYQQDQCGRYPTCQRTASRGGDTCAIKSCLPGEFCKIEYGKPICVQGQGFDSAGAANNPYAHANAPPAADVFGNQQPGVYPPQYPSNNNGYPPYPPVAGQRPGVDSLGYPSYPNQQPNPNQPNNYPGYGNNNRPYGGGYGSPGYGTSGGYGGYGSSGGYGGSSGYGGYGGYRRNGSSLNSSSFVSILGMFFIALFTSRQLLYNRL